MVTCANCGKQFNEPISFCSRCGAPIDEKMYSSVDTLDFDIDDVDILSLEDIDEIETLVSGLSTQQLDPDIFEEMLNAADKDGNGFIDLDELYAFISTILDEESADMFCDHFAETKSFTENGEVPTGEVVQMWLDFDSFKKEAVNPANVIVIKQILDAYKKERQFLDPTNILLDDELGVFSYRDSFDDIINAIDVNKDGKLTETEVRDFLSTFIPQSELDSKVSAFMEELHANRSTNSDSDEDLFVDVNSIGNAGRSLEMLDIDSQITQEARADVDDFLDGLDLPTLKALSTDDIFSEFDDVDEKQEEREELNEIKPIFSRVRVKSAPVEEPEEVKPEKKDLSSFLDASDEELEALLNESGGDLDDMFETSANEPFKVPQFSIDNIFDDFEETPVEELANRLNNNFQYDDDDDEDDNEERIRATSNDDDDDDNDDSTDDNTDDDDDDDDDFNNDFDSQFITSDYSPDIYEESTDEDFSDVFEELLVAPENFEDKVQKDELDEALEYIKNNSSEEVSEQVSARITKDYENYQDIFEDVANKTTATDAIFEEDSDTLDVSAMGPDEFFTNEELTNALLDIKDLTQKKKEKTTEKKPSLTSKIKSRLFVDVKTGTINTALLITLIITGFSVYYVHTKPYQNTFYTNYSEEVITLYDQNTWDTYLSVVGFNDLFLMYAEAYMNGDFSKTEFLDIGEEYISHNTRASNTFLTNNYPESAEYAYNLHLYTFEFTEAADNILTAVKNNAPQSEIQSYLQSMESMNTVDTSILLERENFLKEVGVYN